MRCVAIILYRGIWRWSTVVIGWQRMDQTVRIGWVGWSAKNECVPVVGWLGICDHREKKEKVLDDVDIFAWHVFYVSFWNFVIGFSDRFTGWFCSLPKKKCRMIFSPKFHEYTRDILFFWFKGLLSIDDYCFFLFVGIENHIRGFIIIHTFCLINWNRSIDDDFWL